jgi:hypothetical protein
MAQTAIKIYQKKVTPNEATQFLERNKGNRRLDEKQVAFLLGEMQAGNWISTGDPIKFNFDGDLLDGQHRLTAITRLGKPVELFIAENIPQEAFKVIDTGKMRSAGDALGILGHKSAYTLASVARTVISIKAGRYNTQGGSRKGCSISDIVKFVDHDKDHLHDVVREAYHVYGSFPHCPPSMMGALYYFFDKKDSEKCFQFFSKYATGVDLGLTNPIRILREKLIQNSVNKTIYKNRDLLALHIYAWNAFRENKKVTTVALAKNYEFPKIK